MKKSKIVGITIALILTVILCGGVFVYINVINKYTLSISEKKWVDRNSSNIISIAIPNDIAVFGNSGDGVFFDFTDYLKKEGLNINNNTVSYNTGISEYGFKITDDYNTNGLLLHKDHFVVVSIENGLLSSNASVPSLNAGVLSNQIEKIAAYYNTGNESFKTYSTYSEITSALVNGDVKYAVVPLNEYKEEILKNSINIVYHISDLNKYYYFILGNDDVLNSILTKKMNYFIDKLYKDSYNRNNYQLFIHDLGISSKDEDTLTNQNYRYGFNETSTYETFVNDTYGGITAEYLNQFAEFSGIEFTYKRYNNSNELAAAAVNSEIDLYYNYYDLVTNFIDTGALREIDYYVIANNNIDLSMSNLNGLKYQNVYVAENTYLKKAVEKIDGIKITTYKTTRELKNILKSDSILIVDANIYDYYVHNITNDYSIRFKGTLTDNYYTFRYKNDTDTFYTLLNAYTKTIDPSDILRVGINSYNDVTFKRGIVNYVIVGIVGLIILGILYLSHLHNKNRKIKIDTKVKKEDRIKYIDLLTSLKNRNYLNEKLPVWNKNTIYPQTCIVLDLNRIKYLNDTLGHVEGDRQIMGVANILIRTQVDSSEIIRTDGNEFFIYLVGYSEKQVLSYMKKLVKEFKKLPYDYGVAMGFSMIDDNTKLVEDAFNEASIQMRENKELYDDEDDQED